MIKKWKYQGHNLDYDEMVNELGDVLWYVYHIRLVVLGVDLDYVMERNVEKLLKRYP